MSPSSTQDLRSVLIALRSLPAQLDDSACEQLRARVFAFVDEMKRRTDTSLDRVVADVRVIAYEAGLRTAAGASVAAEKRDRDVCDQMIRWCVQRFDASEEAVREAPRSRFNPDEAALRATSPPRYFRL